MSDQSSKNTQFSWDTMRGYTVVLLAFAFLLTTLSTAGGVTTALGLIFISSAWIGFSILSLFSENRTTSCVRCKHYLSCSREWHWRIGGRYNLRNSVLRGQNIHSK